MISGIKGVPVDQIFVGNGSDEAIDLLFRAFCEPGQDKSYLFPPTYGMYEVSANINNVETVKINLTPNFQLPDINEIVKKLDTAGLLFICSPNNPTGNTFSMESIKEVASVFSGLVVVDEAYIDFSNSKSATSLLAQVPNLVVLQTLSKAVGLAGLRLGVAFASNPIIEILNKVKPPYNVNSLSQAEGVAALQNKAQIEFQIQELKAQRTVLVTALESLSIVVKIYPSEANFYWWNLRMPMRYLLN